MRQRQSVRQRETCVDGSIKEPRSVLVELLVDSHVCHGCLDLLLSVLT